MFPGNCSAGIPIPVPTPSRPSPVAAGSPLAVALPRSMSAAVPIPVAVPSPAMATVSPAAPYVPVTQPVVPKPIGVASSSALQLTDTSLTAPFVLNTPSIPSTSSAPYAPPPVISLALASSSAAASPSPLPVPQIDLLSSAVPVPATHAPAVVVPAVSHLPLQPRPSLSVPEVPRPAIPMPTVSAPLYPKSSSGAPLAVTPSSILVSSAPVPVAPSSSTVDRKVTFALPGVTKEAVAPAPPAVPIVTPSVPVVSASNSLPLVSSLGLVLPSPDLPQLRATEEEKPKTLVTAENGSPEEDEVTHQRVPDYIKWLYPASLKGSAACSPSLKFPLTDAAAPHVLSSTALLRWSEAEVLGALPATLPPEYVMFGGARYSGASFNLLRPPLAVTTSAKRTTHTRDAMEVQRLQFLVEQLEVARHYLKIEARRVTKEQRPLPYVTMAGDAAPPTDTVSDAIYKSEEATDVSKANIWTAAYFGSPQQLSAVMEKRKFDGSLDSAGYVQYRRRQWGLKRAGDTFALGLGSRGTPLQFAAAAGKLESVVLLLESGARDTAAPHLKEILSAESMRVIEAVLKPCSRAPRYHRTSKAEAVLTSKAAPSVTGPAFTSEHVVRIDESGRSPLERVGDATTRAMVTFA
ncbi:hypothetical protein, conserved [Leishmania tarentolae]|uniref:Calphotin-like protein n=1 Tax=Leishmania tarentolae TaxID=5689 RepID=A0A640KWQ8_LEITA|nr:hypothetical protein, conserved [Leishmania tarentolae]